MKKEFSGKPKRFAGSAGGYQKRGFGEKRGFGGKPSFGARKSFGGGRDRAFGDREQRESFEAICDTCGKECRVPFRPNGSKPVLCTNCFRKDRGAETTYAGKRSFAGAEADRGFGGKSSFGAPRPAAAGAGDARLKAIEAKLDRILSALGVEEDRA